MSRQKWNTCTNPGKIEFGTPGARKRARPVWGGLGGNVRQQCRNAPPFHSIIVAARPSESSASTASAGGCLSEDFLRDGFSGGPKPRPTHSRANWRRSNFRSSFITVCLSRLPLFRPGGALASRSGRQRFRLFLSFSLSFVNPG